MIRECPFDPHTPCTFEISPLEDRFDLQSTIGQSHSSMVLQYRVQGSQYHGENIGSSWNAGKTTTDIGDCFSVTPYYLGPGQYEEDAVLEEKYIPKTLSGPPFGVSVLLDAETYDNGDMEEPFDGFSMAVSDPDDQALFGLNSFSVGTGSMVRVSNHISIHRTTDVVLSRFNSSERKCIDDSDNYSIYMV